jgi:hypothetical protein
LDADRTWGYTRGSLTTESYFDLDDKPAPKAGCVRIAYAHDELGWESGVTYLDANHQSCAPKARQALRRASRPID